MHLGHRWSVTRNCDLEYANVPITAMSMLDPHLPDGVHEWRDGKRLVKNGDKLFIEGTDTLAGRYLFPIP